MSGSRLEQFCVPLVEEEVLLRPTGTRKSLQPRTAAVCRDSCLMQSCVDVLPVLSARFFKTILGWGGGSLRGVQVCASASVVIVSC